jgi:predicted MPP superfamily phosphohydrolase
MKMKKKMKKRLRYCSDLHFEMQQNRVIPKFLQGVENESLICAGDTIAVKALRKNANDATSRSLKNLFKAFLEQVKDFDRVYFIMGNHEHYGGHYQSSAKIMRDFIADNGFSADKYVVLDNDVVPLDDKTLLIGSTLWTNMRNDHPDAHYFVGRGMNDFRLITYGDDPFQVFTTYHALDEHKKAMAFITDVVESNPDKRIIMATHHTPSYRSNGRMYNDSTIIDGYCSNLEAFIEGHPNITDWIHGHTHVNVEYTIGQCRITSNMRGYVGYDYTTTFDSKQFLEKFIEV